VQRASTSLWPGVPKRFYETVSAQGMVTPETVEEMLRIYRKKERVELTTPPLLQNRFDFRALLEGLRFLIAASVYRLLL